MTPAIRPPGVVLDIVRTLRRAGFDAWCVGGAVRDALLGISHLDWDLATSATPPQVRRLFERTVPVGIEFGTIGVLDKHGRMHEVTTFRRDVQHDGRHAVVEFGASLDEDLARRDFTINAIAYDPIDRVVHDPFGGQEDLARRLVRAVGDPDARMLEDRLRALRAIRFASRFAFELEAATWQAIVNSAPFLPRLSPERVKQEIEKTLDQVRTPSSAFARWRDSGAFAALVPSLAVISSDTLAALDTSPLPGLAGRPQRRVIRLAILLSQLSGRDAADVMRALRFSNQDVAWVSDLVTRWHRHGEDLARALISPVGVSEPSLRRLVSSLGRLRVGAFMRVARARWCVMPQANAPSPRQVRELHRRLLRSAFRDPLEIADLAIDGDDLRKAGVAPGREIGRILAALVEIVLDDPADNTRATLLSHVPRLLHPH